MPQGWIFGNFQKAICLLVFLTIPHVRNSWQQWQLLSPQNSEFLFEWWEFIKLHRCEMSLFSCRILSNSSFQNSTLYLSICKTRWEVAFGEFIKSPPRILKVFANKQTPPTQGIPNAGGTTDCHVVKNPLQQELLSGIFANRDYWHSTRFHVHHSHNKITFHSLLRSKTSVSYNITTF